jgi:hypothetical protein
MLPRQPGALLSAPLVSGEYTSVTPSEVGAGGGLERGRLFLSSYVANAETTDR